MRLCRLASHWTSGSLPHDEYLHVVRRALANLALLAWVAFAGSAAATATQDPGLPIVNAARAQVGVTVRYDPAYRKIDFPLGDVPRDRGVCTDVIVRALRDAYRIDLQAQVNKDLQDHWDAYPHNWRWLQFRPDPNIDHRRVPNLMTYFWRHGLSIPVSDRTDEFRAGDIVAWDLNGSQLHIGIVSDRRSADGIPLVIHNIGRGVREEDVLFRFRMIGHYRLAIPAS